MKVCKFGGTSMAGGIKSVVKIAEADADRRFVVVSAPGKRKDGDFKVTDALYRYFKLKDSSENNEAFKPIADSFKQVAEDLGLSVDIDGLLSETRRDIGRHSDSAEFAASRGEYLSAYLLARRLGAEFVDADGLIRFDEGGELLLDKSISLIRARLAGVERAVIPGFYGADESGRIRTFSRGGSDITGAIVARAMQADVYENWTDVDGFLSADPRIVADPARIEWLSYKELRELSYMGAQVLHPEAIYPVRSAGIPINIRNTFNPDCAGTLIVDEGMLPRDSRPVTGIAGKKGFTIINIEKEMMNSEIGFGRRVLGVLEDDGISFEHMPSGIDTLSVVIRDDTLADKLPILVSELQEAVEPDSVEIHSGLSLIATVGHCMAARMGTAARLFDALAAKHINVRMIDQGSSELNIIVGVDTFDYEKAINAIYAAFFR